MYRGRREVLHIPAGQKQLLMRIEYLGKQIEAHMILLDYAIIQETLCIFPGVRLHDHRGNRNLVIGQRGKEVNRWDGRVAKTRA